MSEIREESASFKSISEWLRGFGLSPTKLLPGREAPPNSPSASSGSSEEFSSPSPHVIARPLAGRKAPQNSPISASSDSDTSSEEAKTTRDHGGPDVSFFAKQESLRRLFIACSQCNLIELDNLLKKGLSVNEVFSEKNESYNGVYKSITPLIAAAMSHKDNKERIIHRLLSEEIDDINFIAYPKTKTSNHQPSTLLDFVEKDSVIGKYLVKNYNAKLANELLEARVMASYSWASQ